MRSIIYLERFFNYQLRFYTFIQVILLNQYESLF